MNITLFYPLLRTRNIITVFGESFKNNIIEVYYAMLFSSRFALSRDIAASNAPGLQSLTTDSNGEKDDGRHGEHTRFVFRSSRSDRNILCYYNNVVGRRIIKTRCIL